MSGGADNIVMTWNSNFCNSVNTGGIENVEDKFSSEYNKYQSNTYVIPSPKKSKQTKKKRKTRQKVQKDVQGATHDVNDLGTEIMVKGKKT